MFSIFAENLDPMPDETLSMFQMDRAALLSSVFSRISHCKELSLSVPPGWAIIPKYGELKQTSFGDFVELDRKRLLHDPSPVVCAWSHDSSKSILAISHFKSESDFSRLEVEERIARSLVKSFSTIEFEARALRPTELGLVKGRPPVEILSAKLELVENKAPEQTNGSTAARLVTAVYTTHTQPGVYALSALVPLPVSTPLKLMREISYIYSHFWILPRPYADGRVSRKRA